MSVPSSLSRITIADVARHAGVSLSTVDRVLNARAPVRSDTALRIRDAAQALGYHGAGLLQERLKVVRPKCTMGFILQEPQSSFYRAVGRAIEQAIEQETHIRGQPILHFMEDISPEAVSAQMLTMAKQVDALAIIAADHPLISAAIDQLALQNVPVFAIISDLSSPAKAGYVGLDNRRKGRVAAWFLTRLAHTPGPIAILVGSHRFQCQELCEMSFRSYVREHSPEFEVLEPLFTMEDDKTAREGMRSILRRHTDLVGFYVIGSGVEGVLAALDAEGIPAGEQIVGIGHELTVGTRHGFISKRLSAVLAHPVDALAAEVVRSMTMRLTGQVSHMQNVLIPLQTYTPEAF
jgi:LacI family transcriptional regulator